MAEAYALHSLTLKAMSVDLEKSATVACYQTREPIEGISHLHDIRIL